MAFDPDAFLAKSQAPSGGFDPDAFLAKQPAPKPESHFSGQSLLAAPLEALNAATFGASDWVSNLPNWALDAMKGGDKSLGQIVADARAHRQKAMQSDLGDTGAMVANAGANALGTVLPALATGGASLAARGAGTLGKTAGAIADASVGNAIEGGLAKQIAAQSALGGAQGTMSASPGSEMFGGIAGAIGGGVGGSLSPISQALAPYLAKKFAGKRVTPEELQQIVANPFGVSGAAPMFDAKDADAFNKSLVGQTLQAGKTAEALSKAGSAESRDILKKSGVTLDSGDVMSMLDQAKSRAPDYFKDDYENSIQSAIDQIASGPKNISGDKVKSFIQGLQNQADYTAKNPQFAKDAGDAYKNMAGILNEGLKTAEPTGAYRKKMEEVAALTGAAAPFQGPLNSELKIRSALEALKSGRPVGPALADSSIGENFLKDLEQATYGAPVLSQQLQNRSLLDKLTKGEREGSFGSGAFQEGASIGHMAEKAGEMAGHLEPSGILEKGMGLVNSLKARSGGGIALKMLEDRSAMQTFLQQHPQYAAMMQSAMTKGGAALPAALSTILNQDPAARESAIQSVGVSE